MVRIGDAYTSNVQIPVNLAFPQYNGRVLLMMKRLGAETRNQWGWSGFVRAVLYDHETDLYRIYETWNQITTDGLKLKRDGFADSSLDTEIHYMGWGDDGTTPQLSDSQLGNELGRKQITSQTAIADGDMQTTVYLAPYQANVSIAELAWFAGADASGDPNTGVCIARTLLSFTKTNSESLTVDRVDSLAPQ